MNRSRLAPGALLNENRPSLRRDGDEHLTKYNDTPEAAYLDEILPVQQAINVLRPDLVRANALQDIYADRKTHLGVLPRDLVRTYIARMTGPRRRSLADSAFNSTIVPIAEGRRSNGNTYIAQSAVALKPRGPFRRFGMRRRWTYLQWERYGKIDECFYRNGDICIVAEPFCILPCGLMYCYDGRANTVFLLDYESGRAVEVDYGDLPYPVSADYCPRGYMIDDYGEEYNVPRTFIGRIPQRRID